METGRAGIQLTDELSAKAKDLAFRIRQVRQSATTEEDLRIGVEAALTPIAKDLGIGVVPKYEKKHGWTEISGRSDAVYGHVIIEYERPGRFLSKAAIAHAAEQLAGYIRAEAAHYGPKAHEAMRRMIGVGIDGESIFFLRYRGATTIETSVKVATGTPIQTSLVKVDSLVEEFGRPAGPFPVSEHSVAQFLLLLRALRRRPLEPLGLAREFGPKSEIARFVVPALYDLVRKRTSPKLDVFFSEWDRRFGIIYGEDLSKAEKRVSELAELYSVPETAKLKPLFFAVHTYYALIMKFIAAELASLQKGSLVGSFVRPVPGLNDDELREYIADLEEEGGLFSRLRITNFLEADFFGWYLAVWNATTARMMREVATAISDFEPATPTLEPYATRDLLKKLYQYLVPRKLRRALGEFYTPDWLAEELLERVGFDGNPETRLLDPACGSGTFLTLAIGKVLKFMDDHLLDPTATTAKILENIVGFDINPLAVIAARTNYLLALGPYGRPLTTIRIPVYLTDSILTPSTDTGPQVKFGDAYRIPSVEGPFPIPQEVDSQTEVNILAAELERHVEDADFDAFLTSVRKHIALKDDHARETLRALFSKIVKLNKDGRDRLWARIIKNSFAPLFLGKVDFVVGNPPWVGWENLSSDYRSATVHMWKQYGLFSLKGYATKLGGGKKDISMLMLYVAADKYLKPKGRLGFLITQSVFKSRGAGDGFRRFKLGSGDALKVEAVHDLSEVKPFEDASNLTCFLVLTKGEKTTFPLPYHVWRRKGPKLAPDAPVDEVRGRVTIEQQVATPIAPAKPTSPWLTVPAEVLSAVEKARRPADYKAHAGITTWANGIYWVRVLGKKQGGLVEVENMPEEAEKPIDKVKDVVNADLLYPLVRGQDIRRWHASPSAYIIVVQDPVQKIGYDEHWLNEHYPETYDYLKRFRTELKARSGFKKYYKKTAPFYSMYDVGPYTFAPYKVMWRQMVKEIGAAVVGPVVDKSVGKKNPVTQHVVSFVAFDDETEAMYFCGIMNSSIVTLISGSSSTGKSFGSPTVLQHIGIPRFNPSNNAHKSIARLARRCHELPEKSKESSRIEGELDNLASEVWGLTKGELQEVRKASKHL